MRGRLRALLRRSNLRGGRRRAGRYARNVLYFDALVRIGHDLVPGHRGQRTAGHAVGRRVVVVPKPHTAYIIAGEADKPRVAIRVGRAGFACGLDPVQNCALAGALLDDLVHHEVHVERNLRAQHLLRLLAVAVEAPDDITVAAAHFDDRMRCHSLPNVGERRVGGSMIEHIHLGGPDWQGGGIRQRRVNAHPLRGLDDLGAAELGVSIAERNGQAYGDDIDRAHYRLRERHRTGERVRIVLRAPVAEADRSVDHNGCGLEAVRKGGRVNVGLER